MMVRAIVAHLGVLLVGAVTATEGIRDQFPRHRHLRRRLDEEKFQIKLLAAEYVLMEGIVVDNSTEGSSSIGWLDEGDWAAYNITLPSAGVYDLRIEVASPNGDGSLSITDFESNLEYANVSDLPNTGGWQNWDSVSVAVDLPEGPSTLKMNFRSSGFNMLSLELSEPNLADESEGDSRVEYQHILESGSVVIPASEYSSMEGIVIENATEGGSNIGSLDEGDWAAYIITLPSAGTYDLRIQVASLVGDGTLSITDFESNQELANVKELPETGGWHNWDTVSVAVDLPEGSSTLKMNVLSSGWNMLSLELSEPIFGPTLINENEDSSSVTSQHIFENGSLLISAIGYSSMEGIIVENSTEGSSNIGSIDEGDWLAYDITLPSSGTYDLRIEVASPYGDGALSITDFESNQEYANVSDLPNTGGWQNYTTVSVAVELPEGSSTLKVNVLSSGFNMLSLELSGPALVEENEGNSSVGSQHIFESGSLFIPASEYSSMEGIVIESASEGGNSVGWLDAGDRVTYNVSLPSAGLYKVEMRIASPSGNGAFSIADSSNHEFALMTSLPQTGDWQNWQTFGFDLTLPAGSSELVVHILRSGWNLLWLQLSSTDEPAFEPQEDEFRLRIPAEKFLSMQGIVVETLNDGSRYIGWLDTDDWVTYEISIPINGTYAIDVHLSSVAGSGAFEISNLDTREVYAFENNLTSTGDWLNFMTQRLDATFSAGPLTLKLQVLDPGFNLNWLEISRQLSGNETDDSPEGDDGDPVSGKDFRLRVFANNYTSMEGIVTEPSNEGNDSIGSLDAGDSVTYALTLPTSGLYGVQMRLSSPSGQGGFTLNNLETGDEYASIDRVRTTGDWTSWENIKFNATLPSGFLPLQLKIVEQGWNMLWMEFYLLESFQNASHVEQFQVTINASDFSSMEGVELQDFPEGMKHVSYLETSDWVAYNVSIPYEGTYKLKMQITSPSGQGGFSIADMETKVIYANVNTLPATGSWESVGDVNRIILLPAGPVVLQIQVLQPGFNLVAFSLEKVLPPTSADGGGFIIEAPDTINDIPTWDEPVIRDPWTPILEDPVIKDPFEAVTSRVGDR